LQGSACVLILTAHSGFDYQLVVDHAPVVFDTRNGTRQVKQHRDRIVLLST
jgi:UDP-N-acetyl-D-mannosaminuronate dehydrogenase